MWERRAGWAEAKKYLDYVYLDILSENSPKPIFTTLSSTEIARGEYS
jgi:hypothetical protein